MRRIARGACLVGLLSLAACARPAQQPPTAGKEGRSEVERPGDADTVGSDAEHPVPRCGPRDSYAYIAGQQCADGSVPLERDLQRGAGARSGNVGANATGHIIDRYVVPCPEGDRVIFVDMYACPEEV